MGKNVDDPLHQLGPRLVAAQILGLLTPTARQHAFLSIHFCFSLIGVNKKLEKCIFFSLACCHFLQLFKNDNFLSPLTLFMIPSFKCQFSQSHDTGVR